MKSVIHVFDRDAEGVEAYVCHSLQRKVGKPRAKALADRAVWPGRWFVILHADENSRRPEFSRFDAAGNFELMNVLDGFLSALTAKTREMVSVRYHANAEGAEFIKDFCAEGKLKCGPYAHPGAQH